MGQIVLQLLELYQYHEIGDDGAEYLRVARKKTPQKRKHRLIAQGWRRNPYRVDYTVVDVEEAERGELFLLVQVLQEELVNLLRQLGVLHRVVVKVSRGEGCLVGLEKEGKSWWNL